MGYLGHFIVFVLAMLGVIVLALFVYKKFNMSNFESKRTGGLNVEEVLSLSPRKTLYVINAHGERFLIAGDVDRTTLISKLNIDFSIENNSLNSFGNENVLLAEEKSSVINLVKDCMGKFKEFSKRN